MLPRSLISLGLGAVIIMGYAEQVKASPEANLVGLEQRSITNDYNIFIFVPEAENQDLVNVENIFDGIIIEPDVFLLTEDLRFLAGDTLKPETIFDIKPDPNRLNISFNRVQVRYEIPLD